MRITLESFGPRQRRLFPEQKRTIWHPKKFVRDYLAEHLGRQLYDPFKAALLQLSRGYGRESLLAEVRQQLDPQLLEVSGCYVWRDEAHEYKLDQSGTYEKFCEAVCKTRDTIFITQSGVIFRGQWLIFSFGQELSHIPACPDSTLSLVRKHTKSQGSTLPYMLQGISGSFRRGTWPPCFERVNAWFRWGSDPANLRDCTFGVDWAVEKG